MYILVDNTTNIVQHAQDGTISTVPSGQTLYTIDNTLPGVSDLYANPEWYTYQNGTLTRRPFFVGSYTSGTLTVTLNDPPATPPASASIAVAGQTYTVSLTNNTGTLAIAVHPSLTSYDVSVTISALGCVAGNLSIAGTTSCPVALQVYTPTGGTPTVAPTGTGSEAFLQAYYALTPASLMTLLGDIGTAINLLCDTVFGKLVPAAQQPTYAPIAFDANQANALSDIKANVLPNVYTALENAYPSGGTKQRQYADFSGDMAKTFKAYEYYQTDLNTIPNLG